MDYWISEHCDTKLSRMSHCHISCQRHKCVYTCGSADVSVYTVCVCERERMKMGAIGGYNEPTIPSFSLTGKVSQRTSARPLRSLCLFPRHSLSLPTFPLSFAPCPSLYPPSVVVDHSASRSYFGARTHCLEQTHLSECLLPVRPTWLTQHRW